MQKFLKKLTKKYTKRWQPEVSLLTCLRLGLRAFITISALAAIGHLSEVPMIIAPFAASCITIYTNTNEEFAQPANIIGGYLVASVAGFIMVNYFPHQWWTVGIMVALTISAMAYFRVTHPPAGAMPLLMFYYHENVSLKFILFPVLAGSLVIVVMAIILFKIPIGRKRKYPR